MGQTEMGFESINFAVWAWAACSKSTGRRHTRLQNERISFCRIESPSSLAHICKVAECTRQTSPEPFSECVGERYRFLCRLLPTQMNAWDSFLYRDHTVFRMSVGAGSLCSRNGVQRRRHCVKSDNVYLFCSELGCTVRTCNFCIHRAPQFFNRFLFKKWRGHILLYGFVFNLGFTQWSHCIMHWCRFTANAA